MAYNLEIGLENSRKHTWSVSREVSYSIKSKIQAKLFQAVSATVEQELSFGLRFTHGGSTTEVSTQKNSFKIELQCPARHVCGIKQLVYKDDKGGHPEYTCHTAVFKTVSQAF